MNSPATMETRRTFGSWESPSFTVLCLKNFLVLFISSKAMLQLPTGATCKFNYYKLFKAVNVTDMVTNYIYMEPFVVVWLIC